ncbi:GTP cyclohydrolase 1 type 2/Nif3 [Xylariales sp. AK1849]|nr:GTP cyclohydrolase 1 type 2/Nif3 [Xylariales sp. AK1849]
MRGMFTPAFRRAFFASPYRQSQRRLLFGSIKLLNNRHLHQNRFRAPHAMPRIISSFAWTVVEAMKKLYPEVLAEGWDNTGLLIEQTDILDIRRDNPIVLLTNDLTQEVAEEAIRLKASIIVSYHPVIFKGLKCLTNDDPIQASILRLVAKGVAVYCPHTAVDAAHGGLNDWLCDITVRNFTKVTARAALQPVSKPLPDALKGTGYGRSVELAEPMPLSVLLRNLSDGLGKQRYMSIAMANGEVMTINPKMTVSKIAVCAGSGASVLKDTDATLLITGEMSHHDALRHAQLGQIVVTVFHSNSERAFLKQRLKPALEEELRGLGPSGEGRVIVSSADRDPFQVIDIQTLSQ